MQQLIKSKQVQYNFSIRTSCKIKIFDHHPNKPWICYSTSNNVIQVWDYNQKTCIKTFNEVELENNNQNFSSNQSYDGNNNTIDMQKNFDLKSIKFFDKNVLFWLFPNCNQKSQEEEEIINNFKRNWIIFQGDQKVIFYDYVTDKAKVINFAEFEYKNIKCFEIIDHQYLTFACTDGSIKIFDIINWTFAKSMKWNQRSISKMISHKQNEGNRPRLIVSASDGSLACWNVDTNTDVPAFKFLMTKKGKQLLNANDGQDILCMCLDPYNHKLITVSEDYITVWSALAGTEIQRFKNSKGSSIKEIHLLNHHSFSKSSFALHSRDSQVFLIDIDEEITQFDNTHKLPILTFQIFLDLKDNQEIDRKVQILGLQFHQINPYKVFFGTSNGFFQINLNKFQTPNIAFNVKFTSNLTVDQTKDFVRSNGEHKFISPELKEKLKIYEQQQSQIINFMYLSVQNRELYCNLFDSSKEGSDQLFVKSLVYKFQEYHFKWDQSEVQCSFSGKFISVINKENGYYIILQVDNSKFYDQDSLQSLYSDDLNKQESLHFLSEAKKVYDGVGVQIVWHQYLDEFAVLCPLDSKNQFLKIFERKETISTGSFFSKKSFSKYTVDLSEKISKMTLCVYSFEENGENNFEQPKVILINDRFLNPTQLFGNGENYCVVDLTLDPDIKEMLKNPSARKQEAFRMHKFNKGEFFDVDREFKTYKKIGGSIIAPLNVFWSQSNQICICSYSNFFSLFRFDKEQNQMQLLKVHNYTLLDGYFWENLFFFTTENSVNLLVTDFIKDDIILELATIEIKLKKEFIFDFNEIFGGKEEDIIYDNIYPEQQKKPPGQSKILTIYDFKLVLINQNNELGFIYLEHPFIKFCMYLQHQKYDTCLQITNQFDPTVHNIFLGMFLYHQAYQELEQLKGLSTLDRMIFQFEYQNKLDFEILEKFLKSRKYSQDQKKCTIDYLIINLHKNKEEQFQEQIDKIQQLALTNNIITNKNSNGLLIENEELRLISATKQCGNFIIPYILQYKKELLKNKNYQPLVENWMDIITMHLQLINQAEY